MSDVVKNLGPDQLSNIVLFDGLSDADRGRIASWLEIKKFDAGRALTHEGASGYAFFVLHQGTVRVVHDNTSVATLTAGDVFGELAILGDGRRTAEVIAETDVVVLCMFGTHFREMQMSMPVVAARLAELAAERKVELER